MSKKIIKIDQEKCVGCGLCAKTCKQSAIEMIDGKAVVTSEDYCDGIGNCLPVCPVNAISFSDKDVKKSSEKIAYEGCPGSASRTITKDTKETAVKQKEYDSALKQWPVQIKLVSEEASFFNNAKLLIAADCSAFSYADFHSEFMEGRVTIIGCPKLDEIDYTDKLTKIIQNNEIQSVTIVKMEVPCCGGIERAAINALKNSGKFIPWQVVTLSTTGTIVNSI